MNSIPNYGSVIDKVDVFNSVEIRVGSAPSGAALDSHKYHSKAVSGEFLYNLLTQIIPFLTIISGTFPEEESYISEEAIFCLTPSKLFMVGI